MSIIDILILIVFFVIGCGIGSLMGDFVVNKLKKRRKL